ncbi:tyrosine-type recombinase/integrase [Mumia sp. Pv 4-285]|uniref:tyrosine-type recombinase/integrase n=1 Tax=Mumia qirimensis TaxID=3234852 RepID=UPI00351D6249
MARPPIPIGSWGLIRTNPTPRKGDVQRYVAVTDFRDFDGHIRRMQATGATATQARQNLRTRLQERSSTATRGDLTGMTKFAVAADVWLQRLDTMVEDGRRSPGTVETYRGQLRNHVLPAMGEVRLGELTTPLVDRCLSSLRTRISPATAKSAKSVISGVMSLAVRLGAVAHNPVREVDRIEARSRRQPRSLTDDERVTYLRQLAAHERAWQKDLPDLVFFMLATGVRIGEALATVWSDVDLESGTVRITSTLIRVKGEGLVRKSTKSSAGERTLGMPFSAVQVLHRRFVTGARLDQPVFPDTNGGFRDPANVRRDLRDARGEDFSWVTSHTFRKTAATILDEAALSARLVADQLGHARPSMTQDVYLMRRKVDSQAATALESALGDAVPERQFRGFSEGKEEGQNP